MPKLEPRPVSPDLHGGTIFANNFKLICPVQSRAQKYFGFFPGQITGISRYPVPSKRGVSRSSQMLARGAMDADALLTKGV
jgi:hypothetical protein